MTKNFFELPEPRPTRSNVLRLVSLGGLEEVGRNMMVSRTRGKILIIDYRVLFPKEIQPRVDLILPGFSYIKGRINQVVGMVLTHGHKGHVGVVLYLLKHRSDIPVYGSGLTLALVEPKLQEHRLPMTSLRAKTEGQHLDLDLLHSEFCAVNHPTPDALAVMVRTKARSALVTGDSEMDRLPSDGCITGLRAFARWGEEGVDLSCADSTNTEVPGSTPSGHEIGPVSDDVSYRVTGQIVVAFFASYVHRVQQVLNAAAALNRRVALVGRSMVRDMEIAVDKGSLQVPGEVLIDLNDVNFLPPERRIYMATGSRGEPVAALSRIANQEYRSISIDEGDTVVLVSSLIPGSEMSVGRVINRLMRLGARVIHKGNSKVYVSGHATAGELFYVYNIVKPKDAIPIHGEIRRPVANGGLTVKAGVKLQNMMLAEDGVCVEVKKRRIEIVGRVPCDHIYVDGTSVGELGEQELYGRWVLAEEGFVTVYVVMKLTTSAILAGPTVIARGMAENAAVFRGIEPQIADALMEAANGGKSTMHDIEWVARCTLGRWVSKRLHRVPMTVPLVVEVE